MNLDTLRLIAHTIQPIKDFDKGILYDEKLLSEAIAIAKKNKVFLAFYIGLSDLHLRVPNYAKKMAQKEFKRKTLYEEALAEIAGAAEHENIKFMVFKSIKPFPYVGDDIDIFVPSNDEFKAFIKLLRNLGYRSLGRGPPEETVAKKVQGFSIMVDVHRAFSASYIPYVNGSRVWRRKVKHKFNGFDIFVPSMEDEILILVGHSLLKEFRLNLAEFFNIIMLYPKVNQEKLSKLALAEKIDCTLNIAIYIVKSIYEMIYREYFPFPNFNALSDDFLVKVAFKVVDNDLKDGVNMPYYYPLPLPIIAYLDKLKEGIIDGGRESLNILLSFAKAPFTSKEGVNVLWKYIINHAVQLTH
jgi:hypothetical protein